MTENHLYLGGVEQEEELLEKLEKRDSVMITDNDGKKHEIEIDKRLAISQHDVTDKVFILERISYSPRKKDLRFGYYVIAENGQFEGEWVWGQRTPYIPPEDFKEIYEKAEELNFI